MIPFRRLESLIEESTGEQPRVMRLFTITGRHFAGTPISIANVLGWRTSDPRRTNDIERAAGLSPARLGQHLALWRRLELGAPTEGTDPLTGAEADPEGNCP